MKKSLIALAVAGALTAPMIAQADATIYGSLRVAVVDNDAGMDLIDNTSRIGFKATSDLDNGLKGLAHFETYANTVNGDFGTPTKGRLAYIGLEGDFGKLTTGRQWTSQWLFTTAKVDILDAPTSEYAHSYGTGGRQGNMIQYVTPDMSGLKIAAGVMIRGASNSVDDNYAKPAAVFNADGSFKETTDAKGNQTGKDLDAYTLGAHYTMGGFQVGLSTLMYQSDTEAFDQNINAIAVSYSADALYVGAVYEQDDMASAAGNTTTQIAASYKMGNTKLLVSLVDLEVGDSQGLEVQQQLGKKARAFVNYTLASDDNESLSGDTLSLGYRVDF